MTASGLDTLSTARSAVTSVPFSGIAWALQVPGWAASGAHDEPRLIEAQLGPRAGQHTQQPSPPRGAAGSEPSDCPVHPTCYPGGDELGTRLGREGEGAPAGGLPGGVDEAAAAEGVAAGADAEDDDEWLLLGQPCREGFIALWVPPVSADEGAIPNAMTLWPNVCVDPEEDEEEDDDDDDDCACVSGVHSPSARTATGGESTVAASAAAAGSEQRDSGGGGGGGGGGDWGGWRRKWCVLQEHLLAIFDHQPAMVAAPPAESLHVVPWTELVGVSLLPPAGFDLRMRDGRVISLRANSSELCMQWVTAVLQLAAMRSVRRLERETSPEWELVCVQ